MSVQALAGLQSAISKDESEIAYELTFNNLDDDVLQALLEWDLLTIAGGSSA